MSQLTQDSLIEALRTLRRAHPDLPPLSWEISRYASVGLRGDAHTPDADRQILDIYAQVLGGAVRPKQTWTRTRPEGLVEMQTLRLDTVWADVPLQIIGSVTLAAHQAYLAVHPQVVAA